MYLGRSQHTFSLETLSLGGQYSLIEILDGGRRNSRYQGCWRNVTGDDSTSCDDGVSSDGHARQDRGSGPNPHVHLDRDRCGGDIGTPFVWLYGMTSRDEVDLVSDHDLVCDVNGCVARERAFVADEDCAADRDVQPMVGIERRDQRE